MAARCPSHLVLERHLLAPERSPLAGHLAACAPCAARLVAMQRQGEEFLQFVYPATVEAVEAAARPGWTTWFAWRRLLVLAPLLGAVAMFLVVRPSGPPADYLGVKGGGPLGLAVFVQEGSGARLAHDGEAVAAGAALRFRVRIAQPCRLWLLSVDQRGQVSRLFPQEGDGGAVVERSTDLPGGAVLDGQPGPERILALCTATPTAWSSAEAAVRAAFPAVGAEAVRRGAAVAGLAPGTTQDSLLLEKRP